MTKFAIPERPGIDKVYDKAHDKVAKLLITMVAIRETLLRSPRATGAITLERPDPPPTPP